MVVVTRNCVFDRISSSMPVTASLDDDAIRAVAEAKLTTFDPGTASDVRRCLQKLSDRYRKCVMLTYLYGLTYEDLARQMNAPLGTVKTWIHRAIAELGECIGK